jgi:soluble P-type ATPase
MSQSSVYYIFAPTEDITASQLAKLLPILIASGKKEASVYDLLKHIKICIEATPIIENLDSELKKHFVKSDFQKGIL